MKTVAEILDLSAGFLQERKVERSKRVAEDLLSHVLKCNRMKLYMQFDRLVAEDELVLVRALLKRTVTGEPLAYVLGEVEFFGHRIKVDKRVLIPRPETEILTEMISKEAKPGQVLWDICCGSGCIGLSLKKKLPELRVALSDLSPDALALARENGQGLDVQFYQGDLLAPFAGQKADLMVCNPPYIAESEFAGLDTSVRDFEPKMALISGDRGTEIYERLARDLPAYLNTGAKVFFEIGYKQQDAVKEIFSSPVWTKQEVKLDWAGHPRFFFLEKQ